MSLTFLPISPKDALQILDWRYPPPYDVYNPDPADSDVDFFYLLNPENAIYSMYDPQGELVAFCSFGRDGQVPGGDYNHPALDIGLGVRPDLTGQGRGIEFVQAVLDFARRNYHPHPAAFRVTIAEFNQRARRVWEKAGFRQVSRFSKNSPGPWSGKYFVILERQESGAGPSGNDLKSNTSNRRRP